MDPGAPAAMGARAVGLRRVLLERVAEGPLTLETRALLLAPESELFGEAREPGQAVIRHRPARLISAVGRARGENLRRAAAGLEGRWDLIAPIGELARLVTLLPGWRPEPAVIFDLPAGGAVDRGGDSAADVRLLDAAEPGLLDHLSGDLAWDLAQAVGRSPVAAAFVGGRPVSFCYAYLETESLWDVSLETLEGHRRRGLATACARRLIAFQQRRGRRPVWGALEGNTASRRLAARLGFRPCGRLAVLEKPAAEDKA